MKQISIRNNYKTINRLHKRLNVESNFSGELLRNGKVVGYKTCSNPVGRIIFNLYT